MSELQISPMTYQEEALCDYETRFLGVSGGKRSGKSRMITCLKSIIHSSLHPGRTCIVASPTYGMTRRNLLPIYRELSRELNLTVEGLDVKSPSELLIKWGDKTSTIILDCTIENFGRLNGLTLSGAFVDEVDKANVQDAKAFIEECTFRISGPAPGRKAQINITGAPELNGFMGEFFTTPGPDKRLFKWSMMQNETLSDEYKNSILSTIPPSKQAGWVRGDFMYNLDGLVYEDFDLELNSTTMTIRDVLDTERIHVCWDINDGGTSVVLAVRRGPHLIVLDEWMAMAHTEAVIRKVKTQHWGDRAVLSCDPACQQVQSYIFNSGLTHRIMNAAPEIEWRVTAVNKRFGTSSMLDGQVRPHLLINTKKCKVLTNCLMRQGYEKGAPQKGQKYWIEEAKTDISGPLDALGYLVYRDWPYNPRKPVQQVKLRA